MPFSSFKEEYIQRVQQVQESSRTKKQALKEQALREQFLRDFDYYSCTKLLQEFTDLKAELNQAFEFQFDKTPRHKARNLRQVTVAIFPKEARPVSILEIKILGFGNTQEVVVEGVGLDESGKRIREPYTGFRGCLEQFKAVDISEEIEAQLRHFFLSS